jgi:FkbM family methyltransferase
VDLARLVSALPSPLRRHRIVTGLLRLLPVPSVALVRVGDTVVYADLEDSGARAALFHGDYYPQYRRIAAILLRDGGVYFDVGANMGLTSFPVIAALAPTTVEAHLFEANPACCRLLEASRRHHGLHEMSVVNACASDRDGTARLAVEAGNSGMAHVAPDGAVEVAQMRLDDYVRSRAIPKIDLLKIDVEGFEPRVLRGLKRALASDQVMAIFTELADAHLTAAGTSAGDYLDEIRGFGFRVFYCRDEDRQAVHPGPPAWQVLTVGGGSLPVAEAVDSWPGIHTDVLAISESRFASGEARLARPGA